jgi:hypothetical protein
MKVQVGDPLDWLLVKEPDWHLQQSFNQMAAAIAWAVEALPDTWAEALAGTLCSRIKAAGRAGLRYKMQPDDGFVFLRAGSVQEGRCA